MNNNMFAYYSGIRVYKSKIESH